MSDVPVLPNPNPSGSELEPEQSVPIDAASLARHYEQHDVDLRGIVRFGLSVLVAIVVACTVLAIAIRNWNEEPLPTRMQIPYAEVTPVAVPGPGLDAGPEVNLEIIRQRENERLYTYGWVDRDGGIVHIPIEEAMNLLLERGLPACEGEAPVFTLDPAYRLDGSGGAMAGEWSVMGAGEAGENE